jgi:hypothetical protein
MFRSALTLPFAGVMLACLSGCMESPSEIPAERPSAAKPAETAIAAATTATMTWYSLCTGCIMPAMEWWDGTTVGGWTYSYNHPVSPAFPIVRRENPGTPTGPKMARPPGNLVDMDASDGSLAYLSDNGIIYSLTGINTTWTIIWGTPLKGARRVGIAKSNAIAIVTNEVKPGGYGIQVPSNGSLRSWKDIDGGAIDLDWDDNNGLWAVRSNGEVWSKADWDYEGGAPVPAWVYRGNPGGYRISAGGGKVAVITNVYGGSGNYLKRYVGGTTWADIPGQMDHINIDGQGRIWGSNNRSQSFYAALP